MPLEQCANVHNELKNWLVELGNNEKRIIKRSETGDKKIVDLRVGHGHIEYRPDVMWVYRGGTIIIELAFTEDWRAIVGEICLCSLSPDCGKVFIFTPYYNEKQHKVYTELSLLLNNRFAKKDGKGIQYGIKIVPFKAELLTEKKIGEIKELITYNLKKEGWLSEPSQT